MKNQVEIFTDGACRGNPGLGGWGVLLRCRGEEKTLYGGEHETTNNRMELMAAIIALESLQEPCDITLVTDSQYVMNGITSWLPNWKKNNWKTSAKKAVKNKDLWQRLDQVCARHRINWQWVKGHSGHIENELVDVLANQAIDELMVS